MCATPQVIHGDQKTGKVGAMKDVYLCFDKDSELWYQCKIQALRLPGKKGNKRRSSGARASTGAVTQAEAQIQWLGWPERIEWVRYNSKAITPFIQCAGRG